MNMSKNNFWAFYKLRSILDQLLYRNRSCSTTNVSQEQFPAKAVSKVGHGDLMQCGLRFLSTNSTPWKQLDTKMVNGGMDNVQKSQPAIATRLSIVNWVKWILGSIMSLMLPFWIKNWGRVQRIEGEAETIMEEVENVAEVVEKMAIVAEKVSADVADELPANSKLKETVLLIEHSSKVAAQDAQLIEDFIHKVETLKQDVGDLETLAKPVVDKIVGRNIANIVFLNNIISHERTANWEETKPN